MSVDVIKQELLSKLKQEHCFWSYNEDSIKDIPDDIIGQRLDIAGIVNDVL